MDARSVKHKIAWAPAFWAAVLLALALLATGWAGPALAASDQENTFTIESITPDPGSWTIMVKFDRPVPLQKIRYRLNILPKVNISWDNCKQISDRAVALKADFKAGERHLVLFPPKFKANGLAYRKTLNSFSMPRPYRPGRVPEREPGHRKRLGPDAASAGGQPGAVDL